MRRHKAHIQHHYDPEYKAQTVKLAREIGSAAKAASELGVPKDTMYGWIKAAREGRLNTGEGSHTPQTAKTLNEELIMLRKKVEEQEKKIARIKKGNAFLEKANAFSPRAV